MYCDYCKTNTADIAEARRHMLTVAHMRNKNIYELDMRKHFERAQQARKLPYNIVKLCELLNMHTEADVDALNNIGFFEMERNLDFKVAEELHRVLLQSCMDYHLSQLLPRVKDDLLKAIMEEKADEVKEKGETIQEKKARTEESKKTGQT